MLYEVITGDSEDSQLVERFITEEAAEPEVEVESRLLTEAITDALSTLEARDAKVLRLYFGLEGEREHTLEDRITSYNVCYTKLLRSRK